MRKSVIAVASAFAVAAAAVPAQAHKPERDGSKESKKCTPHKVGFTASGKLESAALTQTEGAGTETRRDDRYSGTVAVDVRRVLRGQQSLSLRYATTE